MHKKPLITSSLGAVASIIDHKINGLLVDPNNLQDVVKSIEQLYANAELCKQYGNEVAKKASRLYTVERIYEDLLKSCNKVI